VQDDWRVSRGVLLSPGIRYGAQGHAADRWNLSPRFSAAWAPFKNGSLTLRGSYGYFYDWIAGDLYKQSLLVDGYRQRELNVAFPSYPEVSAEGIDSLPSNRYLWSDDLSLPSGHRLSLGIERVLTQNGRLSVNYTRGWGGGVLRGRNLNTPVDGVRPDQRFVNVVALESDGRSRSQGVNLSYSLVRMDLKRLFLMLNYTWTRSRTNTAGGFSLPAADTLDSEWGPSMTDVPHRAGLAFNLAPFRNFSLGLNVRAQSGLPYNVTTGRDDNVDGVFNDRPAGVSRNSARGAAQWDLSGRMSYAIGFGKAPQTSGGTMVAIHGGGGGGLAPGFGGGASDKRYRIEFYVSGQNLLNRANFTAYSYVKTSPFYGQPVAASQPRKLQVGVRFGF
jgi:hypothetical protein